MNDFDDLPTPRGLTRKQFLRGLGLLSLGAAFAGPLGGFRSALAQEAPAQGGDLALEVGDLGLPVLGRARGSTGAVT